MVRLLFLVAMLGACSPETGQANRQDAQEGAPATGARPPEGGAESAPPAIDRPAGAAAPGPQEVIGATPGPCGSTKATEFLGRTWSPEVAAALKRKSGADEVRVAREMSEEEAEAIGSNPRRLNVVLNDSRQIILMDCG